MRIFFNVLAVACAGLAGFGFWIMWAVQHSPGDDNPIALIGAFFLGVGACLAALFAWVATRFRAARA
ncbi:MAG: hypothetical protein DI536_33025 [Archangium gephyra]|uniref:Uncharacterized protein n=1 Tax=Archangium gephyra TaxID=48 RepID=A0A2W5SQW9_9BACT|nr:MAG: hypothetical protein DI536_33025 [Archangium gephyra]